jgi:anti-sigma B factor antagonist
VTTSDRVPSALQIEEHEGGPLAASGELDLASAPQMAAALGQRIAAGAGDVVVDLSGLQFCDSTGLSVFVEAHRSLQNAGRRLVLRNPSSRVHKLLVTTKLDQVLDVD